MSQTSGLIVLILFVIGGLAVLVVGVIRWRSTRNPMHGLAIFLGAGAFFLATIAVVVGLFIV